MGEKQRTLGDQIKEIKHLIKVKDSNADAPNALSEKNISKGDPSIQMTEADKQLKDFYDYDLPIEFRLSTAARDIRNALELRPGKYIDLVDQAGNKLKGKYNKHAGTFFIKSFDAEGKEKDHHFHLPKLAQYIFNKGITLKDKPEDQSVKLKIGDDGEKNTLQLPAVLPKKENDENASGKVLTGELLSPAAVMKPPLTDDELVSKLGNARFLGKKELKPVSVVTGKDAKADIGDKAINKKPAPSNDVVVPMSKVIDKPATVTATEVIEETFEPLNERFRQYLAVDLPKARGKRTDEEMKQLSDGLRRAARRVVKESMSIEDAIALFASENSVGASKTMSKGFADLLALEFAEHQPKTSEEDITVLPVTNEPIQPIATVKTDTVPLATVAVDTVVETPRVNDSLDPDNFVGPAPEFGSDVLKNKIFGENWEEKKKTVEATVPQEKDFVEGESVETIKTESDAKIEALREALAVARQDYARMDYKKTTAWDSMKRFFGKTLSKDEDRDVIETQAWYQNALMNYQNARFDQVKANSSSQEEIQAGFVEILREIKLQENVSLYSDRTDAKMTNWMVEKSRGAIDWYRALPFEQKLMFSGVLMVGGAVVGFTVGAGAAGAMVFAQRAFGAAAAGTGASLAMDAFLQEGYREKIENEVTGIEKEMKTSVDIEKANADLRKHIIENTQRNLNEMAKRDDKSDVAGFAAFATTLFGIPALVEKIQDGSISSSIEDTGSRLKEVSGSIREKVSGFLDTYTNHNAGDVHLRVAMPPTAIETPAVVSEVLSTPVAESVANEVVSKPVVTSVVEKGGSIIESLRHADIEGIRPLEAWKEYAASNANNPFAVSEKFTMPGAQVLVENGKITDIVDKQGVLLGAMRELSGGHPSVWREVKDMSLDQVHEKYPKIYQNMMESMAKYQEYLDKNMPEIKADQSMKQLVSGLTKAYVTTKGW